MKTGVYFYNFDLDEKKGVMLALGVRFEIQEFPIGEVFDETKYPIFCDAHPELNAAVNLKNFKRVVNENIQ